MTHPELWNWQALCAALALPEVAGPDVSGVSIDSRRIRPGELFVALPGDLSDRFTVTQRSSRDGHDFVADAFSAGAAGALVHRDVAVDMPLLRVQDTVEGLWQIAAAARARIAGTVVAVTGSSGKTTAKLWLAHALDAFATQGSLNNHLGVPLSLALTPAGCRAVIEIGTNHPGEIAPLSRLSNPDVALLLNVQHAHIGNFADWTALRAEKLSIAAGLTRDGVFVVPESLAADARAKFRTRVTSFGEERNADVRLCALDGDRAQIRVGSNTYSGRVPGGGVHRAQTLSAVVAAAFACGGSLQRALELPADLVPEGRGTVQVVAGITVVDDSYNANPRSMAAALMQHAGESRGIAVVGEMAELGEKSADRHLELADACHGLEAVFCVGEGSRPLFDALPPGQRRGFWPRADADLTEALVAALLPGDRVLVKGSRSVFWLNGFVTGLIEALRAQPHDDS